jgi:hypothetical protein
MAEKAWKILGVLRQSVKSPIITFSFNSFQPSTYVAFAATLYASIPSLDDKHVPVQLRAHRI